MRRESCLQVLLFTRKFLQIMQDEAPKDLEIVKWGLNCENSLTCVHSRFICCDRLIIPKMVRNRFATWVTILLIAVTATLFPQLVHLPNEVDLDTIGQILCLMPSYNFFAGLFVRCASLKPDFISDTTDVEKGCIFCDIGHNKSRTFLYEVSTKIVALIRFYGDLGR